VLDIEASGFGRDSFPIEIGYVLADGTTYCSLIRPAPAWNHWDAKAERVHGIDWPTLVAHGRGVAEVAAHLNDRLRGLTVYCDGWAHDYAWLGALFEAAGTSPTFRLDNLRGLLDDRDAARFGAAKDAVALEMKLPRHRASTDARLLQLALLRLWPPQAAPLAT
jgi:hypothetical protein